MSEYGSMRSLAAVLIAFLVGAGCGYLYFGRPRLEAWTLRSQMLGEASSSAGQSQTTHEATTDSKAQRLVAAALRKGRAIERDNELYLAIEAFTAEDFRGLMTDLGALKAMSEQLDGIDYETAKNLSSAMIGRWVDVDPGAALKWMPRLFELVPKDGRDLILDPLAVKQPEELLGLVSSRKKASERADIISRALAELAAKAPNKAQAWLSNCTDPADRRVAETAIRKGIVKADPLRAVELAGQISDRREGIELIASAARHAAQIGPGMIRQLATQPLKGWMLPAFLNESASHDPELAVDLALKSDASGLEKTYSLRTAFTALADRNRELAISRLDGLTGAQRASAVAAIGSSWSAAEPEAALAWLAEKTTSEREDPSSSRNGSQDALLIAFSDWAASGPDSARAWADALPPGQMRDAVQTQMARMLAATGKAAEATQILSQLGSATDPKVLGIIASAWAQRDPSAAAEWAVSRPAGEQQDRAIASVVGTWANDDPQSAAGWLAQFPPGETRDRSILAYLGRSTGCTSSTANQLADFDQWFDRIDDPWQRSQAAVRSFWTRLSVDREGAREWLSSLENVDPTVIRMTLLNNPR